MNPWPDLGIDGEPELLYQPAVDLATGRLIGFEAFLRLRRTVPVPGYILPNQLIPSAEAKGQMRAVNRWVLSDACATAMSWPPEIRLSVNCAVDQLRRGEASAATAAALHASGLDPGRLSVEVPATELDHEAAVAELRVLSRLGLTLTIDDVGPDLPSPERLQHLAADTIKIGGALIGGLEYVGGSTRAIVEATVKASHTLGLRIVAKAIETAGQLSILREIGTDIGQGYFFAPPLPAGEALALTSQPVPWGDQR